MWGRPRRPRARGKEETRGTEGEGVKALTNAPGHPPSVKMSTSHRLSSIVRVWSPADSSSLGKKTLNIVYAADSLAPHTQVGKQKNPPSAMPHHAPHTSSVVLSHSGDSTIATRSIHARSGRRAHRGSTLHTGPALLSTYDDADEVRLCNGGKAPDKDRR